MNRRKLPTCSEWNTCYLKRQKQEKCRWRDNLSNITFWPTNHTKTYKNRPPFANELFFSKEIHCSHQALRIGKGPASTLHVPNMVIVHCHGSHACLKLLWLRVLLQKQVHMSPQYNSSFKKSNILFTDQATAVLNLPKTGHANVTANQFIYDLSTQNHRQL